MANPGNTGQRYKLSLITAIGSDETHVIVTLSCGHVQRRVPFSRMTPAETALYQQQGHRPLVVGKTRWRCDECQAEK